MNKLKIHLFHGNKKALILAPPRFQKIQNIERLRMIEIKFMDKIFHEKKAHKIKLYYMFCDAVLSGEKSFEIRLNDRDYHKGDHIRFIPYLPNTASYFPHPVENKEYEITYVLTGWGLKDNYVAFGIKEVSV